MSKEQEINAIKVDLAHLQKRLDELATSEECSEIDIEEGETFIDRFGVIGVLRSDGLVGKDGLIEIKSRIQKHQIKTIIDDEVPLEYMLQIQTGLIVSERKWCDFISYSNGMPMFVKRVYPIVEMQNKILETMLS